MALAVKGSRFITVDGAVYRWRLRRNPTYGQECLGSPLTFAVELADARGAVLAVTVPDVSHPASLVANSTLIVRPALVAAVIRAALGRGWEPAAPGAPFRLSLASRELPAEAKTEMIPGNRSSALSDSEHRLSGRPRTVLGRLVACRGPVGSSGLIAWRLPLASWGGGFPL